MPRITVCIPSYNYGRYIGEAVESVIRQTYTDLELLVVDNASTDETEDVVSRYAARDSRIRFFRNSQNLGMAQNFNRALRLASGDAVKVLCADDYLDPHAIERSLQVLEREPGVSMVTTGRMLVGPRRQPVGYLSYSSSAETIAGPVAIDRCLFGTNYIGEPSAVLFKRALAQRGFDERYPHLIDMEMWFHLLEQGDLACIPAPLTYIRQHEAQATQDNRRTGSLIEDKKRIFDAYVARPYVRRTALRCWLWRARSAYNIWNANRRSADVRQFLRPSCFYAILPLMLCADVAHRLVSRVRAAGFKAGTDVIRDPSAAQR